jgi:hypothetical protein
VTIPERIHANFAIKVEKIDSSQVLVECAMDKVLWRNVLKIQLIVAIAREEVLNLFTLNNVMYVEVAESLRALRNLHLNLKFPLYIPVLKEVMSITKFTS